MPRDFEAMARALRGWLPGGERLRAVRPLSTGHSNETYLLEGLDRILRTPPSEQGLLPPYDMAFQHRVLGAVRNCAGAPPVARVFELCTDPSVIGDAFFVMERLPGEAFEYVVPEWLAQAGPDLRNSLCAQWIGALARVHGMPVDAMPAPARTPGGEARHWRAVAERAEAHEDLLAVLDDLAANPPPASGPSTPLHGDPKVSNCLWHEGRLTGLLDWEMAGVGEPLSDLGYLLSFFPDGLGTPTLPGFDLPGWWDRSRSIAAWEEATGRSAAAVARHEALAMGKLAAILATGWHLYRTGRATDPRFAPWQGADLAYVTLMRLRKLL